MSTVLTILPNGKVLAYGTVSATSRLTAGAIPITVTIAALRKVEKVLQWNLNTSPQTNYSVTGIKIDGNVVGATVYVAAGTTISGEVVVLGW